MQFGCTLYHTLVFLVNSDTVFLINMFLQSLLKALNAPNIAHSQDADGTNSISANNQPYDCGR